MIIVDTSVLIDYLAGRLYPETEWMNQQIELQRLGLTSLILNNVLQGIRSDALFLKTLNTLSQFEIFETGSTALAIASARNHRALRARGITVRNTIDCILATFCIEEGHRLLHHNRDFDGFAAHLGLVVVDASSAALT